MKKIEAVIRPFRLDAVKEALAEAGVDGMAVTQVKGTATRSIAQRRPGASFQPRVKLEIVVRDRFAGQIASVIAVTARASKAEDGNIFVIPVEAAMRIRTGEFGDEAI